MTDELPTVTAFSKVKTKLAQECYNDNDTDSSVSDSDAPTVEHFNISVSTTLSRPQEGMGEGMVAYCRHGQNFTLFFCLNRSFFSRRRSVSTKEQMPFPVHALNSIDCTDAL